MPSEKKWYKPNVPPEMERVLKQIALDEGKYIYEVIEDTIRDKYPSYFQECNTVTV
ncbi:MAG: hypothetical protein PHH48_06505 [Eubacteriales bacterium]|nr:hypothetical protein [Eubacteriales bacterium]